MSDMQATHHAGDPLIAIAPSSAVLALVGAHFHPWAVLTPVERDRCRSRRSPQDQAAFTASRTLARLLLARQTGTTAALAARFRWTQRCTTCGGPHGRPILDAPAAAGQVPIGISWASAGGVVAAAVGTGAIGIDIARPGLPNVTTRRTAAAAAAKAGLGNLTDLLASRALFTFPGIPLDDPATQAYGHVVCGGQPAVIDVFSLVEPAPV